MSDKAAWLEAIGKVISDGLTNLKEGETLTINFEVEDEARVTDIAFHIIADMNDNPSSQEKWSISTDGNKLLIKKHFSDENISPLKSNPMTTKPKFSDLTPEQVNDLIAVKIMGWEKTQDGLWWRDNHLKSTVSRRFTISILRDDGESPNFDPCYSLDDCWKAEEKLSTNQKREYSNKIFREMYLDWARPALSMDYYTALTGNWFCLHATPQQKCEAMLRAIGEVE